MALFKKVSKILAHTALWDEYTEYTPAQPVSDFWPDIQVEDINAAVHRAKGTAPGLDMWQADEISRLTDDMWKVFLSFITHCETLGRIPTAWGNVKQIHLPKGKPPQPDGSVLAADLRPVSVTSIWWRAANNPKFRLPEVQQWVLRSVPSFLHGGIPGKGVEDARGGRCHCALVGQRNGGGRRGHS